MILIRVNFWLPYYVVCAFGRVFIYCNGDGKKRRADRLNMLDVRSLYVTYLSEEER